MPPSKLIVTIVFPPQGFCLLGGVNYEGGRSNQKSSFMRGVIVPPSKLIVKRNSPKVLFLLGGFIIKGGRLYYYYAMLCYTILYYTILYTRA